MADRSRFLLAYDIRSSGRLRNVHRIATDFGYALQYSVFVCDLTKAELITLKARLLEAMNTGQDSIGIFDLGPADGRGVDCVEFLGVRAPLPEEDGGIW